MRSVLLDTSAYFAAPRIDKLREAIDKAESVFLNAITLGELQFAFHGGRHFERNRAELQTFLEETGARVLPINDATAEHYGAIRQYLKKAGTPVSPNDLWIAATAMQYGLKLLTTDSDFQKIPQILIELF